VEGQPSATTCSVCALASSNLSVVCPPAGVQYDAAGTNPLSASQVRAHSGVKADFLLDCGHAVTREIGSQVRDHRHGRPGATACLACSTQGADLATVCPAAAAQYDAAERNPVPANQVRAGSNRQVSLRLDCGHDVTRRLDHHVEAHRTGRPSATRCPACTGATDPSAGVGPSATHEQPAASNATETTMTARKPAPGRDLAAVCPAAAAQYDAADTNEVSSTQIGAGSEQRSDFLLNCGHTVNKTVTSHVRAHKAGRSAASACPRCSRVGQDLATVCPAAAAQYDAANTNPVPSAQITAGSNSKADFVLDCGHTVNKVVASHVKAHNAGQPAARACPRCPQAGRALATVCPAAAAQYDAANTNPVPSARITAGSNSKADFVLDCGHTVNKTVNSHVRAHRAGQHAATTCQRCPQAGRALATVCPAAAAQYDAANTNPVPSAQITAGSNSKADFLLDCGHTVNKTVNRHVRAHKAGQPAATTCPRCPQAGRALATICLAAAAQYDAANTNPVPSAQVTAGSNSRADFLLDCGHIVNKVVANHVMAHRYARPAATTCAMCAYATIPGYGSNNRQTATLQMIEAICAEPNFDAWTPTQRLTFIVQGHIGEDTPLGQAILSGRLSDIKGLKAKLEDDDTDPEDGELDDGPSPVCTTTTGDPEDDLDDEPEIDDDGLEKALDDIDLDGDGADDEPRAADGDDRPTKLPYPTFPGITDDHILTRFSDEFALEFLIASSVATCWGYAYDAAKAGSEALDHYIGQTRTKTFDHGSFGAAVRARFLDEYEAACFDMPDGWAFRPKGSDTVAEPLLMQRHVASLIRDRRRVGNWSGTGAGKTVSAVLGAQLIDAGRGDNMIVVICPNGVVDGWVETITSAFGDNRVATKTLDPTWGPGDGPRWLVVNYEQFSQRTTRRNLDRLTTRPDTRIDMVVLDEIHRIKLRGATFASKADESKTREAIRTLVDRAGDANPELAVLGMSATPVVNDLTEARSVLEVVDGQDHQDLATRATVRSCLHMHQHFMLNGLRYRPKYESQVTTRRVEVDVDHLVDDIHEMIRTTKNPTALDYERALLPEKLPVIVDACLNAVRRPGQRHGKTLVYVQYLEEIVGPITEALEASGLRVGLYTGGDKDGLEPFIGRRADGTAVPEVDQVDVLIGSEAVGTGIDGLQLACDNLVFAVLPWTAANYDQVLGRLNRTAQTAPIVHVTIPVTVAPSHLIEIPKRPAQPWSWDRQRLALIRNKSAIADAVVDGGVADHAAVTEQAFTQSSGKWLSATVYVPKADSPVATDAVAA
jgi:superfamily II DNA or RNA helicase